MSPGRNIGPATPVIGSPIWAIARDARYYLLSFVLPALVNFFALMVYTRVLSASDFGLYSLVMATASLANVGFFGWLANAAVRFWAPAAKDGKDGEFFTTTLLSLSAIAAVSGLLWYLTVTLLSPDFGKETSQYLKTGTLAMLALGIFSVLLGLLQAQRQVRRYMTYSILNSLGKPMAAIALIILARFDARALLLGIALVTGGISVWEIGRITRERGLRVSSFSRAFLVKFYRYGLPVAAVGIITWVITWTDRYLIGYFLGAGEVGVYSAGYGLIGRSLGGLVSVLQVASLPILILKWEERKQREVKDTLRQLIGIWFLIASPVVVGVWGFRVEIVQLLLGKSFQGAAVIVPWLSIVSLVQGALYLVGIRPFQITKQTGYIALFMGIASLVNIGLNFILIPRWGIVGAAISSLLSYVTALIISYTLSGAAFRFSLPWRTLTKVCCSSIGMYLVIFFIKITLILPWLSTMVVALTLGMLVYLLLIWLTREEIARRIASKLLKRITE